MTRIKTGKLHSEPAKSRYNLVISFLPGPGEIMNPLSQLPSVDRLLSAAALAALIDLHGRAVVTAMVRDVLAATRARSGKARRCPTKPR
jgi:hypothetical protein